MELTWKNFVKVAACAIVTIAAYTFFTEPVGTQKPSGSKPSPAKPAQVQRPKPKPMPKAPAKLSTSQDQIKPKEEAKEEAKAPEKLTREKFLEINDEIYKRSKENFAQIHQKFLNERRQFKADEENYRKSAEEYAASEQSIIKKSAEEVLAEKSISNDLYEQAENEFGQEHSAIAQKQTFFKSLTQADTVPEALTVDLLKEILKDQEEFASTLVINEEDPFAKILAHAKIEDYLYEKYNFEMAEINAAKEKHQADVKALWRKVNRKYQALKIF